jgi:hypothetical protein
MDAPSHTGIFFTKIYNSLGSSGPIFGTLCEPRVRSTQALVLFSTC